jgi:hypothetical protein
MNSNSKVLEHLQRALTMELAACYARFYPE